MSPVPPLVLAVVCILAGLSDTRAAHAQAATTGAIAGRVVAEEGRGIPGVEVTATNRATGVTLRAVTRAEGRYRIGGLDVGGPYVVSARRIGSPAQSRGGLYLSLGQQLQVDLVLAQQPVLLQAVRAEASRSAFSRAHTGTEALLSDSLLRQMPVMNRDLYDLVRLAPQVSTFFALTASGAGPRVNAVRIDGITDQVPSSNLAAGALYGGRVIPLDAVREVQVLLSPYDVRHGGFAGVGVNVVTRSGTNELRGTAFGYGTSERFGRNVPFVRGARYEKSQVGFSLGGPIVRDRLHYFVSSELQRRTIPAVGPHLGQSASSPNAVPVTEADVARFQQLLGTHGLGGGSAGAVTNPNPSSSTFLRLDAPIPGWNSRLTLRGSYGHADSSIFARPTALAPTNCPPSGCFSLSSLQHSRWVHKRTAAAQLVSNLPSGAYNELVIGYMGLVSGFRPAVHAPLVLVTVPGTNGTPAVLQSGTHEIATGQRNATWTAELTNNLSFAVGAHRVTLGVSSQLFDLHAFQVRGSYGVWEFASLDSLQSGRAARYRVTRDTGSVTAASGAHHALYVGDEWDVTPAMTVTLGLRADVPVLSAQVPYVAAVDSIFGRRTDDVPSGSVVVSPRVGFNYRPRGGDDPRAQLRGGAGLFAGRPPLFWLFGGFAAYGLAARTLQCGPLASDAGRPPAFRPDHQDPPHACAGGETFGGPTSAEIDVIDGGLRLPQTLRASLALDAHLPFGIVGTVEGLLTRATRGVHFRPLNLQEPVARDRRGRVMYGAVSTAGTALPTRVAPGLGDIIAITSQSRDRTADVTGTLRKQGPAGDVAMSLSVSRSRDAGSPRTVSAILADAWRSARPVAGRHDDLALGVSDFDQPLRLRVAGTLRSPWRRFGTAMSLLYVGGSGLPYTYVAGGAQGRGDLNADGAAGNDPLYIPRSASDTSEIRFAGTDAQVRVQQAAFDEFVSADRCLAAQRGRIMTRNSCRAPWMSVTHLALRQTMPSVRAQSVVAELQVFNLLNLLNPRWGRLSLPTGATPTTTNQVPLLTQVATTGGPAPQPVYRFDTAMTRFSHDNFDTYYQIQVAVRYNF